MLFNDDDHRPVVIVAVAEGFLAVLQFVEVVFAPVPAVDKVEAVEVQDIRECLKDVGPFRAEVSAGKQVEEGHRQFLPIAPLEVIHAVEAGTAASFDLQEEVGSLANDKNELRLSAKVGDSYFAEVEGIAKLIY